MDVHKRKALLEEAARQIRTGRYGRAAALLKQLSDDDADHAEVRGLKGTLQLQLGDLLAAKGIFEGLAMEAIEGQNLQQAESLLHEYLAVGSQCVPLIALLARTYEAKGELAFAAREYAKALDILLNDPEADGQDHAEGLYARLKKIAPNAPELARFAEKGASPPPPPSKPAPLPPVPSAPQAKGDPAKPSSTAPVAGASGGTVSAKKPDRVVAPGQRFKPSGGPPARPAASPTASSIPGISGLPPSPTKSQPQSVESSQGAAPSVSAEVQRGREHSSAKGSLATTAVLSTETASTSISAKAGVQENVVVPPDSHRQGQEKPRPSITPQSQVTSAAIPLSPPSTPDLTGTTGSGTGGRDSASRISNGAGEPLRLVKPLVAPPSEIEEVVSPEPSPVRAQPERPAATSPPSEFHLMAERVGTVVPEVSAKGGESVAGLDVGQTGTLSLVEPVRSAGVSKEEVRSRVVAPVPAEASLSMTEEGFEPAELAVSVPLPGQDAMVSGRGESASAAMELEKVQEVLVSTESILVQAQETVRAMTETVERLPEREPRVASPGDAQAVELAAEGAPDAAAMTERPDTKVHDNLAAVSGDTSGGHLSVGAVLDASARTEGVLLDPQLVSIEPPSVVAPALGAAVLETPSPAPQESVKSAPPGLCLASEPLPELRKEEEPHDRESVEQSVSSSESLVTASSMRDDGEPAQAAATPAVLEIPVESERLEVVTAGLPSVLKETLTEEASQSTPPAIEQVVESEPVKALVGGFPFLPGDPVPEEAHGTAPTPVLEVPLALESVEVDAGERQSVLAEAPTEEAHQVGPAPALLVEAGETREAPDRFALSALQDAHATEVPTVESAEEQANPEVFPDDPSLEEDASPLILPADVEEAPDTAMEEEVSPDMADSTTEEIAEQPQADAVLSSETLTEPLDPVSGEVQPDGQSDVPDLAADAEPPVPLGTDTAASSMGQPNASIDLRKELSSVPPPLQSVGLERLEEPLRQVATLSPEQREADIFPPLPAPARAEEPMLLAPGAAGRPQTVPTPVITQEAPVLPRPQPASVATSAAASAVEAKPKASLSAEPTPLAPSKPASHRATSSGAEGGVGTRPAWSALGGAAQVGRRLVDGGARLLRVGVLLAGFGLAVPVLAVGIISVVWLALEQPPNDAFFRLTKAPPGVGQDPTANGYFVLVGLGVDPAEDPMRSGYEAWEGDRLRRHDTCSPVALAAERGQRTSETIGDATTVVARYRRWLGMTFHDEGYGHRGTPDCQLVMTTHRLYVEEGLKVSPEEGLQRLEKDVQAWRTVFTQARSLPIKILATQTVSDDMEHLSSLLQSPALTAAQQDRIAHLVQPLDRVDRSLRWPIQGELAGEIKRIESLLKGTELAAPTIVQQVLLRLPLPSQRVLNGNADYADALIKAGEGLPEGLPAAASFVHAPASSLVDYVLNPVDNLLHTRATVNWNTALAQVLETDARIRLVALQAKLHGLTRMQDLPTRLAKAGPDYFDPFTGLPMLLNDKRDRLYSVGPDREDHHGDPRKDLVVPLVPGALAPE